MTRCRRKSTNRPGKSEFFNSSGSYSETNRDIVMVPKGETGIHREQTHFWWKLAAGQFWQGFGRPKLGEGDQMRSVDTCISQNFQSWACKLKSLLPIIFLSKSWFSAKFFWGLFGDFWGREQNLHSKISHFGFLSVSFDFFCMKSRCKP